MFTARAHTRTDANVVAAALLGIGVVGVAWGTVNLPWFVSGAVLGAAVLAFAMTAPLVMVAIILATGPVDLSFLTGGFKALLPAMGGLDMNGIRLVAVTAGFLAYIMFEPRSRAAAAGPLARIWILFLLFAGASLAVSLDKLEGLRLLLKLGYPLLMFLIVIGVADTSERASRLMDYTIVAAVVLALIVNPLLALNGGYRVEAGQFVRVGGLGKGDNPYAFYCTAMLLIAFTRFVMRMQIRYLLLCVLLIAWIALTMTRIAAFAATVGIATIGIMTALATGRKKLLVISAVAVTAIAVVLLPNVLLRSLGFIPTPGELFQIVRNPIVLYKAINWQGRELLWAILWAAFLVSPVVGRGLGSSTAIIVNTFPDQSVKVAHNEYMRLGTDTGVLGVLLFFTAVMAWLVAAVRMGRRGDQKVREFAFPAIAGIMVWGIIAITDNAFDYYTDFTQYIGLLVAGAVVTYRAHQVSAEVEHADR